MSPVLGARDLYSGEPGRQGPCPHGIWEGLGLLCGLGSERQMKVW